MGYVMSFLGRVERRKGGAGGAGGSRGAKVAARWEGRSGRDSARGFSGGGDGNGKGGLRGRVWGSMVRWGEVVGWIGLGFGLGICLAWLFALRREGGGEGMSEVQYVMRVREGGLWSGQCICMATGC